ncbi:MAG: enoyl-CoA hydratase/isomerase family protein [Proteobacteria bacterium]|nr:enoyl-CoA hydratase/isomerase family protein [Pseudomonadota bacterium]
MSLAGDALVQVERRGAFWFARLNRPDKRNALSEPLMDELLALCDRVEADADAHTLVLWGAGGSFCAGADFGGFLELMAAPAPAGPDPIIAHNRRFGTLLERMAALPVPTLGVIRGAAMGGGVGLASVLDRVIATDDAVYAMPEVTLGVAPAQIAPFVARRIGATRARWRMLAAARLDADAAHADGFVDVVVPMSVLKDTVAAELGLLALTEPAALRATKRLALRNLETPLTATLDAAARDFAELLRSGSAREGIAASRERRRPAWHTEVPALPEFD